MLLLPDQPEALGLLALMLFCKSRRDARRSPDGSYIPLSDQDRTRWSRPMIAEAEAAHAAASAHGRPGRFQLQAAIQAAHTQPATDWDAVARLYEALVQIAPTTGALVGRAAAVAEAQGAAAGWALLDMPAATVAAYQPYWALAGHLLARLNLIAEARVAYQRAMGLCEDPAMRAFLAQKIP